MTAAGSRLPLASLWWQQHELRARVQQFCSTRQPTPPPRRALLLAGSRGGQAAAASSCLRRGLRRTAGVAAATAGETPGTPPVLLVSACLLGCPVTYRGTNVRRPATLRPTPLLFLTEVLWRELGLVRCVPMCPEVEWLGLPVPRPPLRLVREAEESEETWRRSSATARMDGCSCRVVRADAPSEALLSFNAFTDRLPPLALSMLPVPLNTVDGVVLKSRSPSCGVSDARRYAAEGGSAVGQATVCGACPHSQPSKDESTAQHLGSCARSGSPPVRAAADPLAVKESPSSDKTPKPYELVDGFAAALLRNSLHDLSSSRESERSDGHPPLSPPAPTPVITSDRLLSEFHAADDVTACLPSRTLQGKRGVAGERIGAEHICLDAFIEHALRHRNWRLDQVQS